MKKYRNYAMILSVVGMALLLVGVTYSFFNYTKSGNTNIVRVGSINFSSSEADNINLTNAFPITRENAPTDSTNSSEVIITISGDTDYGNGVEYLVSMDEVQMETSLHKSLPIGIIVTPEKTGELGTSDDNYFTNRGGNSSIYKVLAGETIKEDDYILVGYIKSGQQEINGTIGIRAFIDLDHIAITDTYDGNETDEMGTTNTWTRGRTVITTSEWNSMTGNNSLSFKIKVEANEGVWVPEINARNDTKHILDLFQISGGVAPYEGQKSSITEINFIRMSEEMINTHADAINITAVNGEGLVKAWIDGTKLYIASPGETYLPVNSSGFFNGFTNLVKINFNNVNTSLVTNMNGMFYNCSSLQSIDLSSFDTSLVTTMSSMFSGCSSLTNVDLSYLDTSSVVSMPSLFSGCTNLVSINISGLGSSTLSNVGGIFSSCPNLTTVNMSNFNFGSVSYLGGLFDSSSTKVTSINLSGANMYNISSTYGGLSPCTNLKYVNMDNVTFGTSTYNLFYNLFNLETVSLKNVNTSRVTDMSGMFKACSKLTSIDLSSFNTSSVTYMDDMFNGCTHLTSIDFSGKTSPNVTTMEGMFDGCTSLETVNLSGSGGSSLYNIGDIFAGCSSLKSINMHGFNFGSSSISSGVFTSLSNLESVDLSNTIYGYNADAESGIFNNSNKLKTVNISNTTFASISGMFRGMNITSMKLIGTNMNRLTNMSDLFMDCSNLRSVDLSEFDSSHVTNMRGIFSNATALTNIDLSNFSTASATTFEYMFKGCGNLTSLDLSSFNTGNVTNVYQTFVNCSNLKTIYVSNTWDVSSVTSSTSNYGMFFGCASLVGGNGTRYTDVYASLGTNIEDAYNNTYAVIDTPSQPGYLTIKN